MRVLLISANIEHINILPPGLNYVAVAARNAGHREGIGDGSIYFVSYIKQRVYL